jgi:hypothetical protein
MQASRRGQVPVHHALQRWAPRKRHDQNRRYWARSNALQEAGAQVHLAHPLGVKAFEYRRVKNDVRDATDLADLLRSSRSVSSWRVTWES